jgi:hypothetical protein
MDITNQFQEVSILLTQDGLVTVLKQNSMPVVSSIVGHGITGQKPAHQACQRNLSGPNQKVDMVG